MHYTNRHFTYLLLTYLHHDQLSRTAIVRQSTQYTSLRHSQSTSFTVSHSTSPDRTTLPAQHFRPSGLLCRWSDSLELATGQSLWPGAQQQQLQTIAEDEISSLRLSTHSAVEMHHVSALLLTLTVDLLMNLRTLVLGTFMLIKATSDTCCSTNWSFQGF